MLFPVIITSRIDHHQIAWAGGFCERCGTIVPVRVEQLQRVRFLYLLEIERNAVGSGLRCDICERSIHSVVTYSTLSIERWSPRRGLRELLTMLMPPDERLDVVDRLSDRQLHAVLASAQDVSLLDRVDILPGIAAGAVLGLGTGLIAALAVGNLEILGAPLAKLSILSGVALGPVIGAVAYGAIMRKRVALRCIRSAYLKYRFDLSAMELIAAQYRRPVRQALRQLRDNATELIEFEDRQSS